MPTDEKKTATAAAEPAPAAPAAPQAPAAPMVRVLNKGTSDVIGIADRRTHHLPPGESTVPAALWAKLKQSPAVAHWLLSHVVPNPDFDADDPNRDPAIPETITIPPVLEVLG